MKIYIYKLLLASLVLACVPSVTHAQLLTTRTIVFPVAGSTSYSDDFLDPRSGGRAHEGTDIFGKKRQQLIAAVDGTISFVVYPEATYGYMVSIRDKDNYRYNYIHINNDNPGTDDGKGDGFFAYAPDMASGLPVVKGQLIGYMGDSGNAETTPAHLHFEIRTPEGDALNPYESLKMATKLPAPLETYPALPGEILPYGNFTGGMSVAAGDLLVTGAGPGGGPLVRTFDEDGTAKQSWYAYGETFRGGVDVATADVDGDGTDEVITAPGSGGGPHIRIFKADGAVMKEFFAYDPRFHGGVNVTAADLDNDSKAEIITGPGATGGPHIKAFKTDGTVFKEFLAYDARFTGGVDVAATAQSIITAPGKGGGPHIKVFNNQGVVTKEFFAYEGTFNVGVRVSAGMQSGSARIATLPATGGGPHLKTFRLDGTEVTSKFAGFEQWWRSGYDLAVADDTVMITASGRRASLRPDTFLSRNNRRFDDD